MKKKAWSITTTVRNPARVRDFLVVLQQLKLELGNARWDANAQVRYQILLIKNRLYGYGNGQFYSNLSQDEVTLISDLSKEITIEKAESIFKKKNYTDPPLRGRQSMNPLTKMGLVAIRNDTIVITDSGKLLLVDNFDYEHIFFKSFLKWQIPNPGNHQYPNNGTYDIKPFVGTLHLINAVNQKEVSRGNSPKGISKPEFSLFAPTLIHHQDIEKYATKIVDLRSVMASKGKEKKDKLFRDFQIKFAQAFLDSTNPTKIKKFLQDLRDYGDNAIRYFRLTRYIYIRGNGYYVDLEPRRSVEIDSMLGADNAQSQQFQTKDEYSDYISDISQPQLPWETREKQIQIIKSLTADIKNYEIDLQRASQPIKNIQVMEIDKLNGYAQDLREYRKVLQGEVSRQESQMTEQIESYISALVNIFNSPNRPILLEKLSSLGLLALNDALNIRPNYPVGDDNEPTCTAPANTPDIECFYETFNAICEVTMLTNRSQWYHEGQPVMRHLREFENKYTGKPSYCIFIAPSLHRDTINTFWAAVKYEYEGRKQRIVPLSIMQFVSILEFLLQIKREGKFLKHNELAQLFDEIIASVNAVDDSSEWILSISDTISSWQESIRF